MSLSAHPGLLAFDLFRSVARVYPFATRGLAPRMLVSLFQMTRIKREIDGIGCDTWRLLPQAAHTALATATQATTARDMAMPNALRSCRVMVCSAKGFMMSSPKNRAAELG